MIIKRALFYKNGTIRILGTAPGGLPRKFKGGKFDPNYDGKADEKTDKRDGIIKKFSNKSRQRLNFIARETTIEFKTMLTLTYPNEFCLNGRDVKSHLHKMLKYITTLKGGADYIWILEFQVRGAPHFHVLLDIIPDNRERFFAALRWSEIVGRDEDNVFFVHSSQDAWSRLRSADGSMRYIAKYALKPEQKIVPLRYRSVGRFWGVSSGVLKSIPRPTAIDVNEADLRVILHSMGAECAGWEHLPIYAFTKNGR